MQTDILTYKILLLGDTISGKTCFFNRYLYNTFDKAEKKSIGQTSGEKSVKLKNGKKLILKIWDICA